LSSEFAPAYGETQYLQSSNCRIPCSNGDEKPISDPQASFTVSLPKVTVDRIRHQAALMRISDATLTAALLQAIVDDDLYKAVLDQNGNSD
jgi:hypothetical protein